VGSLTIGHCLHDVALVGEGNLQAPPDLVVVFDDKDLDGGKSILGLARTVVTSSGGHCAGIWIGRHVLTHLGGAM